MWPRGLQFSHLLLHTDTLFFQQADLAEELHTHRSAMNMYMGILTIQKGPLASCEVVSITLWGPENSSMTFICNGKSAFVLQSCQFSHQQFIQYRYIDVL